MPSPGPRVSFDLKVGKNVAPGSHIDFDETSLNGYLKTIDNNKGDYPAHIRVAASLGSRAFGVYNTNSREITLLSLKLGGGPLDDAMYSLAHPDAIDATRGVTHQTVVDELNLIGASPSVYAEKARELSAAYAAEYLND